MTPATPIASENDAAPASPVWRKLLVFVQVAVTVLLLAWLFHDPGRRQQMFQALSRADWWWLILSFLAAGVCELFGVLRWQLFLRMLKIEVPLREVVRLFFIGAFFNQFLPGTTGGDVARVLYLMQDRPDQKTAGFLSVAVDRLIAATVLVIIGLFFAWGRGGWFAQSFAIGELMRLFAVTLCVLGAFFIGSFVLTSRHLVARLPRRFPLRKLIMKISRLWQLCLENSREALLGTIYTIPMLFAYFSAFAFAARAFTDKVSLWDMISLMPLVTAVSSLPTSLNGMGVREALIDRALYDLCDLPLGMGMLISIAGMTVYLLWGLLGGVFYFERLRRRI